MQIAVLVLRGSDKRSLAVVDRLGDSPSLFVLSWKHQLAIVLGVALASVLLWHTFLMAISRANAPYMAGVIKHARVVPLDSNSRVQQGDVIAVGGNGPIIAQKVVGLPKQTIVVRESGAAARLLVLGADRYYVTNKDGAGFVVNHGDIRGLVHVAQN